MLTILFVLYYFSRFWALTYFIMSYLVAVFLFVKSTKYYFPDFKNKENPFFHKDYPGFNRTDGHHVTFGRVLYGVLNYFWFKIIGFGLSFFGFYLYYK